MQDASITTCSQSQSGSVTIVVNPLPTATIRGATTVCQNASSPNVTFTGANGTAPYTFTYQINGGANTTVTTTSGNSVTVSAPTGSAGSFIYSLLSIQDASTTTCSKLQSGSVTIVINPLPTAIITGTTSLCQNSAAPNITFTGASGTAPYTFTYKLNGGSNQTVTTTSGNSVTVSVPTNAFGTFVYTLVSVQDASPTSCSRVQSGSATVTVNSTLSVSINPLTICEGSDGTLCAMSSGSSLTYIWSNGLQDQCFTATVPNTYSVLVTDGNNCTGTASTTVILIQAPVVKVTASGPTTICQGDSVILTASGASAFTWNNGSHSPSITVKADGLYTVTGSNVTSCSISVLVYVTVYSAPAVTITSVSNTTFCQGASVTLNAWGAGTYLWSTGGTTLAITANTSGTYSVVGTDGNGCKSTATSVITVNPLPTIGTRHSP